MVEKTTPLIEKVIEQSFKKGEKSGKTIKQKKTKIKKILRKPTVKLPSHSARRVIEGIAKEQGPLVREVENRFEDPVQDNRSLFFRAEFAHEKRKAFGGFI